MKSENTCRRRECREWEREGERCNVDHRGGCGDKEKAKTFGKASPRMSLTIAKPGGNPTLANLSFLGGGSASHRGRGKAQKSTRTVPQLCERGKLALVADDEVGGRGNRAVPEQELQPNTTRDRRRSPTGGASTLPTPVREVGTKARSGVESSEKLEKTGSDTLKTTVANNDLVWSPRRWQTIGTAPPPISTKQAKQKHKATTRRSPEWLQSSRPTVPPKKSSSTDTKTSSRSFRRQRGY